MVESDLCFFAVSLIFTRSMCDKHPEIWRPPVRWTSFWKLSKAASYQTVGVATGVNREGRNNVSATTNRTKYRSKMAEMIRVVQQIFEQFRAIDVYLHSRGILTRDGRECLFLISFPAVPNCSFPSPFPLPGSAGFYSHYLPNPIGYSHSLPLSVPY